MTRTEFLLTEEKGGHRMDITISDDVFIWLKAKSRRELIPMSATIKRIILDAKEGGR